MHPRGRRATAEAAERLHREEEEELQEEEECPQRSVVGSRAAVVLGWPVGWLVVSVVGPSPQPGPEPRLLRLQQGRGERRWTGPTPEGRHDMTWHDK